MKLQIALDTLTLEECVALINEVREQVGIIEVGTPMVIESGMVPIRELKKRFPELDVLADVKIVDAGGYEAGKCFEAGADIVTVLGVSHDATIADVVRCAGTHRRKVMADMICVQDVGGRARRLDELGVDYICAHTAFDVQSAGGNPLDELRLINRAIRRAKSAVAGGVKLATIDEIVAEGAEVIVVGGAICNAPDRAHMAKALKGRLK